MVKKVNKETKEKMSKVAEMGCVICAMPCEIHHLTGGGMGLKSKKFIGLCPYHHRTGGHGNAVHAGTETWESIFGTQEELWERTEFNLNKRT